MRGYQCLFLSLFFIFLSYAGFSQNYYFDHYNIQDGLAESQVVQIYQDDTGYLWLGTFDGLSRFNGKDFNNYTKADGFGGDFIYSVCQDGDRMLVRTESGISAIQGGVIKNVWPSINYILKGTAPMSLVKGADGHVWFLDDKHLNCLTGNTVRVIPVLPDSDMQPETIATDRQGRIYVAVTGKGIYHQVGDRWVNAVPFTGKYKNLSFEEMLLDRFDDGLIYILTGHQLYVSDHGTIAPYRNKLLDTVRDQLYSLIQDRKGSLWVGTWKGVCYLRPQSPIRFTSSNGFTNSPVYQVYQDAQDNIWMGTNGDGFYRFQGFDFMSIGKVDNTPLQIIMGIGQDDQNNVWVGSDGAALFKYDGHRFQNVLLPSTDLLSKRILSIAHKEGEPLLVGSAAGLWSLDHGTFRNIHPGFMRILMYDQDNTVWAVTGSGIFRFKRDGRVDTVRYDKEPIFCMAVTGKDSVMLGSMRGLVLVKHGQVDTHFECKEVANSSISCLVRDGNLVIVGTASEGVFTVNLETHRVRKYTTRDGIRSNSIYSLLVDGEGTIWAGTGKGMDKYKIDPVSQRLELIRDIAHNPVVEFNSGAIFVHDDKVWGGSTGGLYVYNIHPTSDMASQQPVVVLDSVRISGYGHKHVTIAFSGIFYTDPGNLQYQYRLKELDKQFTAPSKVDQAQYTALPPGEYTFEVRAVTANGVLSDVKEIPITIQPTFYQTTLFFALVIVVFISLVFLTQWYLDRRKNRRRMVLEAIKREEQIRIRRQTSEDFHDDIGNSLTRIVVLADILDRKTHTQTDEQKVLINQIRDNARKLYSGAKDILWALDPQSDDLHEVVQKIRNHAIDLFSNTGIEFSFDLSDDYPRRPLPLEYSRNISMIFKELFNNVLKHAGANHVVLTTEVSPTEVRITVKDDGYGYTVAQPRQGRGLANVAVRAKRIGATISSDSAPGRGARTTLTLYSKPQ